MKNFHLQITTPSGLVYDGQASQISARAIDGEIKKASCSGGLLNVGKDVVRLISNDFQWK